MEVGGGGGEHGEGEEGEWASGEIEREGGVGLGGGQRWADTSRERVGEGRGSLGISYWVYW